MTIPFPCPPAEFKRHCIRLNGGRIHGWRLTVAEWLNVSIHTVNKWVEGVNPVPGPAVAALRLIDLLHEKDLLQ